MAVVDWWSLFSGLLSFKSSKWDLNIETIIDRWLLFGGGGGYLMFDCIFYFFRHLTTGRRRTGPRRTRTTRSTCASEPCRTRRGWSWPTTRPRTWPGLHSGNLLKFRTIYFNFKPFNVIRIDVVSHLLQSNYCTSKFL